MATSGTFTGGRGGGSTGPYLTLRWERIQTDVTNNKSLIRLTLNLTSEYQIKFSASKSGNLHGTAFTYTGGFTGPQTKTLKNIDVWVSHNSDGTKTQNFSATFNIAITWGSTYVSSLSVSGNATIDTIPRTSTFSAASLANTVLSVNTAVNLSYTVATASTAFTNSWEVWANGHHIRGWDQGGTGTYTQQLTAADVNKIIASTTAGSGFITVKMYTKSGSTYIGSVTRTVNFTLNSNIAPVASALAVSIAGSGRDKTINKYVQGISKLTASFTATPGYQASITASTITVKRQTDNGNSQTITGTSGTTGNVLSLSGVYIITASCTDSRGRSHSVSTTVTVEAYSTPYITSFSARRGSPTSTVTIARNVSWSTVGGSNTATILIQGTTGTTTTTLVNLTGQTTGTHNTSSNHTGQSDAASYTYTITVTDSFGQKAVAEVKIGTSFSELTISKGNGIGVAKVWERGALDVGGTAYVSGDVILGSSRNRKPMVIQTDGNSVSISGQDLNTDFITGIYMGNSFVNGPPVPSGQWCHVQIMRHNNLYTVQQAFEFNRHVIWFRQKYNGTWTAWRTVNHNLQESLWTGANHLLASNTIYPTKTLSSCANGWMFQWSQYTTAGAAADAEFNYTYLPKTHPAGTWAHAVIAATGWRISTKYFGVYDDRIGGHDGNYNDARKDVILRGIYEW